MAYTRGNLAFDEARARLNAELEAMNVSNWNAAPARKQSWQEEQSSLVQNEYLSIHAERKAEVGARRRRVLITVLCLGIILSIFGVFMIRESEISEKNFANTALRNKIDKTREDTQRNYNMLLSNSDTAYIEKEALRLFSLRKSSQNQRILVDLPEIDQMIFYNQGNSSSLENEEQNENFNLLEEHMRQLAKD